MKPIRKAINYANSTASNDLEKAKIYVLIAIYNELETLNRILAAKFNIVFEEDEK